MTRALIPFLAAFLMLSSTANALSCMRPDLMRTMEDAKQSDTVYYLLVGRFTPQGPLPKQQGYSNNPKPVSAMMWFDGKSLSPHPRTDVKLSRFPVQAVTSCAGSWCGHIPDSRSQMIAFVEVRRGQPPVLNLGACPQWVFNVQPQSTQIKDLLECFDKSCKPSSTPDYR